MKWCECGHEQLCHALEHTMPGGIFRRMGLPPSAHVGDCFDCECRGFQENFSDRGDDEQDIARAENEGMTL